MTIVKMFVLIICSVIQIIAALFQIVSIATGKAGELMKLLTDKLMNIFDRKKKIEVIEECPVMAE